MAFYEALSNLGIVLRRLDRLEEAVSHCREAVRLAPGYAETHVNFGAALAAVGEFDEAEASYGRALEINPNFNDVYQNLGALEVERCRPEVAVGYLEQELAIKPDDALATYFHGYVLKRLRKDLNQALAAFERAIAIDPNLAVAHNYVGQIKVFLGRASEAAEYTLKAIQLSPRDPQLAEWYYQLAIIYIHQQRFDEAVEWARRGVQVNPNLRYPYRVLAASLALSGRVDEARMVAAEMLRRYPNETIGTFLTREPWTDPVYRAGQDREIAGMRLAGIPE